MDMPTTESYTERCFVAYGGGGGNYEIRTVKCDNFLDENDEVPCPFEGEIEVEVWATRTRYLVEWCGECPECGGELRGEDDRYDGP